MITGNKLYILADIGNVLDTETGDRVKTVVNGKILINNVELVGINTAQYGQSLGFNLSYSISINRINYDNERYLLLEDNLFEVKNISKAKLATKMLLNVEAVDDEEIKTAIEDWKNANI